MKIKITIEKLDEILTSVDQLAEATSLVGAALAYKRDMTKTAKAAADLTTAIIEREKEKESESEKATDENETTEEKTQFETKAEGPPPITIEQIREIFVTKNSVKGNTPKLKEILNTFEVKKVTDLEEKDFPEVLKALEEI